MKNNGKKRDICHKCSILLLMISTFLCLSACGLVEKSIPVENVVEETNDECESSLTSDSSSLTLENDQNEETSDEASMDVEDSSNQTVSYSTDDKGLEHFNVGDLDGNDIQEFMTIESMEEDNYLSKCIVAFYFNNERVFEHEDILPCYPTSHAWYLDLDQDGDKEVVLPIYPYVNSMPLTEYEVLKCKDGVWFPLEVYTGEDCLDNQFPIHIVYGSKKNEIIISCDGTDKTITYDITKHYEAKVVEYEESEYYGEVYKAILEGQDYVEGADFGSVAAWGVWDIWPEVFEGRNCLVANHGIQGPEGKFDILGDLNVYFDYDEAGKIQILDIVFKN